MDVDEFRELVRRYARPTYSFQTKGEQTQCERLAVALQEASVSKYRKFMRTRNVDHAVREVGGGDDATERARERAACGEEAHVGAAPCGNRNAWRGKAPQTHGTLLLQRTCRCTAERGARTMLGDPRPSSQARPSCENSQRHSKSVHDA